MEDKNDEPVVRSERYSLMEDEDWRTRALGPYAASIWSQSHTTEPSVTRVKCRATTCQLVQLVKFMENHPELAVSHAKPFAGSDALWNELADHINQFGPPKTYKQCKTTWRDLRKRAFAMLRGRNKKGTGRNLYGMAPNIVSLITKAGVMPRYKDNDDEGSASSSKPDSPSPPPQEAPPVDETGNAKGESTKGEQLVIRVTDSLGSKRNVFNRFTINDGHFENIIVKEEMDAHYQEQDQEPTETEGGIEPHEQSEEMFPQPEAILGTTDEVIEEKNSVIRDLNDTLRKFLTEYKTRNALMRERIDLERARLQFDMEVYRSRQMEKRVIAVNAANAANVINANPKNVNANVGNGNVITVNANAANPVITLNPSNAGNVVKVDNPSVANANPANSSSKPVITISPMNANIGTFKVERSESPIKDDARSTSDEDDGNVASTEHDAKDTSDANAEAEVMDE